MENTEEVKKDLETKLDEVKELASDSTVSESTSNPTEVEKNETPSSTAESGHGVEGKKETDEEFETEEELNESESGQASSNENEASDGTSSELKRRKGFSDSLSSSEELDSSDEKKDSHPSRVGVTFDNQTFKVPNTKNPLAFYPIQQWDFWDYTKNAAALNFLLLLLPLPKWTFIAIFIFWRLMYNVTLGFLLHKQSKEQAITKFWTNYMGKTSPFYPLLKKYMAIGITEYDMDNTPAAYNAWIGFRHLVDIILAQDLVSYAVFCLAYFEWPGLSFTLILCYIAGFLLCYFSVWAKTDAYRVVKDFAWYWGDFFFLINQRLTFDRVFSLSPHPMYTIGYSFFYGAALICQSYTVLYVSLFGHFCQLAFLSIVEDPHIEKTYPSMVIEDQETTKILYDTKTGYFRRDLIVFKNLDLFRSSDLFLVTVLAYVILLYFLNLPEDFYIGQAAFWRLLHSCGLGYVLYLQSKNQFWTQHFINKGLTKQFAFEHWKGIFNLSVAITHVVFVIAALKGIDFSSWDLGGITLLKITIGLILIAINLWSSMSTFEVLGDFGWFYGDFFIDEVPSTLYYNGIYRFVNNPDSTTGFAGYYGMALISDNWSIFVLALFSQAMNGLFVYFVETPHMKKLYGDKVRGKSGIEQAIREIVNEAVDANPNLKKIKHAADKLEKKAKARSKEVLSKLKESKEKIEEKIKVRRATSANSFALNQ